MDHYGNAAAAASINCSQKIVSVMAYWITKGPSYEKYIAFQTTTLFAFHF